MPVALQRVDDATWPALQAAIATHWQARHPLLDKELFDWLYRGYGAAADGAPWGFIALDGEEVVGFVGLIPAMVRHVKPDGAVVRPQALIALWFVAPEHRAGATGVLLLKHAERELEVLGSLGVNPRATALYRRLGWPHVEDLARWVVPLGPGYAELLATPTSGALDWPIPGGAAPAAEVPLDPAALAALAPGDVSGLDRTAAFYAWRYGASVGYRYTVLGVPDGGRAIVRVETPAREGAEPVLRIIELLPAAEAPSLLGGVLAWGRERGCCAADFQVSAGDALEAPLAAAGFRRAMPEQPETMLAEVLRPYRPAAARINVVFRPDEDDVAPWRFLKSDGDMDRSNEPYGA